MKILPNRTMRLGGKRVEAGKVVDVPQADGDLAIRHGWAAAVTVAPKDIPKTKGPDAGKPSEDGAT